MKKLIIVAALAALACGCATKSRHVELKGMYVNGKTGAVAIGYGEVDAIPEGTESATMRYSEDTAWLQPQIKTHDIRVLLTGTNAVEHIVDVVKSICDAYQSTAPAIMQSNAQVATSPLLGSSTLATAAASAKSLAEAKAALKSAKATLKSAACSDGSCATGECVDGNCTP